MGGVSGESVGGGAAAGRGGGAAEAVRLASRCATVRMDGRASGSPESMISKTGVNVPLRWGGLNAPDATRCKSAMEFRSVPKGGVPSRAAYNVAPSPNTSEAKLASAPRATSGAR